MSLGAPARRSSTPGEGEPSLPLPPVRLSALPEVLPPPPPPSGAAARNGNGNGGSGGSAASAALPASAPLATEPSAPTASGGGAAARGALKSRPLDDLPGSARPTREAEEG